jgi:hypothetical protein
MAHHTSISKLREQLLFLHSDSMHLIIINLCHLTKLLGNNTRCAWAGGTFFRCFRKVPPAHAHRVCFFADVATFK